MSTIMLYDSLFLWLKVAQLDSVHAYKMTIPPGYTSHVVHHMYTNSLMRFWQDTPT